jgi:hypothetical protein
MNGTVMIDAITATENTINASLNRHGKRLVQCLVFSKIDIVITSHAIGAKENLFGIVTRAFAPLGS